MLLHRAAIYCKCVFTVSVMYKIISRPSGNQHVCVSHRPSLISAPPTVYTPHGCTLIQVYWAGFLILLYSRSHLLSLSLSHVYHFSVLLSVLFPVNPVISFPPPSHGKVFIAGSSSALHNTTRHSFNFSGSHRRQYCHYRHLVGCFLFLLSLYYTVWPFLLKGCSRCLWIYSAFSVVECVAEAVLLLSVR